MNVEIKETQHNAFENNFFIFLKNNIPSLGDTPENNTQRNIKHIYIDGKLTTYGAKRIDGNTGEEDHTKPPDKILQIYYNQMTPEEKEKTKIADIISQFPNPNQITEINKTVRTLINPTTGKEIDKVVPRYTILTKYGISIDTDEQHHDIKENEDGTINMTSITPFELIPQKKQTVFIPKEYIPGIIKRGGKTKEIAGFSGDFIDPSDSKNLLFLEEIRKGYDIAKFNTFYTDNQYLEKNNPHEKPKQEHLIGLISLGGTIAMKRVKKEGKETLIPKTKLIDFVDDNFRYKKTQFFGKTFPLCVVDKDNTEQQIGFDSAQEKYDYIADLAIYMTALWNELNKEDRQIFPGFVIAHGTDTLVESMALLKMMLGPDCPFSVIGVGSMNPGDTAASDAKRNTQIAIDHIKEAKKQGQSFFGVAVDGGIYNPTRMQKIKNKETRAFIGEKIIDTESTKTPDYNSAHFHHISKQDLNEKYDGTLVVDGTSNVKFMAAKPTMGKSQFSAEASIETMHEDIILLEAFPSGHPKPGIFEAVIKKAKKLNKQVFIVHPILNDENDAAYNLGTIAEKYEVPVLPMTTEAAIAKLDYGHKLFAGSKTKIKDFMTKNNFVGEQPKDFSPYPIQYRKQAENLYLQVIQKEFSDLIENKIIVLKKGRYETTEETIKLIQYKDTETLQRFISYNKILGSPLHIIELIKTVLSEKTSNTDSLHNEIFGICLQTNSEIITDIQNIESSVPQKGNPFLKQKG